tara:strand:+ start:9970 stop:10254 length:285 start_codon:yes stop_codon:yes gene_type:complete
MRKIKYKTLKKARRFAQYEVVSVDPLLEVNPALSWIIGDRLVVTKEWDGKWRSEIVFIETPTVYEALSMREPFKTRKEATIYGFTHGSKLRRSR